MMWLYFWMSFFFVYLWLWLSLLTEEKRRLSHCGQLIFLKHIGTVLADPHAADFELCWTFKHLGVAVGPEGRRSRWTSALQKYLLRTALVRATRASFARSASLYRSMAFSTLQFLSSYDSPPRSAFNIEAQGISRALGAPMWAMPVDLIASLHEFSLPDLVSHLRAVSLSARVLHLRRLRGWQFVLNKIKY